MSTATIRSAAMHGFDAVPAQVSVSIERGLPGISVSGMYEEQAAGVRSKVRLGLARGGFEVPRGQVSIAVASDGMRLREEDGVALAALCGVLAASGQVDAGAFDGYLVAGGLRLDGGVEAPGRGVAQFAQLAEEEGLRLLTGPSTLPGHAQGGHRFIERADGLAGGAEPGQEIFRAPVPQLRREMTPEEVEALAHKLDETDRRLVLNAAVLGSARAAYLVLDDGATLGDAQRFLEAALGRMDEFEYRHAVLAQSACRGPNVVASGLVPALTYEKSATLASLVGGGRPVTPGLLTRAGYGAVIIEGALGRDSELRSLIGAQREGALRLVRADGAYVMPLHASVLLQVDRDQKGMLEISGLMAAIGVREVLSVKPGDWVHAADVGRIAAQIRGDLRAQEEAVARMTDRTMAYLGLANDADRIGGPAPRPADVAAEVRGQCGTYLATGGDPANLEYAPLLSPARVAEGLGLEGPGEASGLEQIAESVEYASGAGRGEARGTAERQGGER